MIMRSPVQTKAQPTFISVQTGLLQRKCFCGQHTISGGECEECKKKRSLLQRHSTNQAETAEVPPIVHEVLRSPGQPLDFKTRTFLEPRFGHDFSQVRVHTDAKAAESARTVNALAYTVGQNIVFGAGKYATGTTAGRQLLAHELVHTIQQRNSGHFGTHQTIQLGSSNDAYERSARLWADRVLDRAEALQNKDGRLESPTHDAAPDGSWLLAHDLTHVIQQTQHGLPYLQRFTIEDSCRSTGTLHSATLINRAVQKAIDVVSSSDRPQHCLRDNEEFQQGVLNVLRNTTIRCEPHRSGIASADVLGNSIHLQQGAISRSDIEVLAGIIFHEALHIWEGRFGPWQHTGIVTPCTAACFPRSSQPRVNTNPRDCVMPPLPRGSTVSGGLLAEATRGGGLGAVLSYRRTLFKALQGHLVGQLGLDVSYEHLFSEEARRRYGSNIVRLAPTAGLAIRPEVRDRKGLLFNLNVGPSVEISEAGSRPGIRFNLGPGLEYDFLSISAGMGAIVPLSDEAQWILDFTLSAEYSF